MLYCVPGLTHKHNKSARIPHALSMHCHGIIRTARGGRWCELAAALNCNTLSLLVNGWSLDIEDCHTVYLPPELEVGPTTER